MVTFNDKINDKLDNDLHVIYLANNELYLMLMILI